MPSRAGPRKPGHSTRVNPRSLAGRRYRFDSLESPLARGRTRVPSQLRMERSVRASLAAGASGTLCSEGFVADADGGSATAASRACAWRRSSELLRPTPTELRNVVAADAFHPDERPRSTGEQDDRGHRRAPRSVSEATADYRPDDQGKARDRDGVADEPQRPHRLVSEDPCPGEPDDHQHDAAQALEPSRPAEERPPQDHSQHAAESPHHPALKARESRDRRLSHRTAPATVPPRRPRQATA